jgi:hypothetical protein
LSDARRVKDDAAIARARIRRKELTLWLVGFGWPALRVYALGTTLTLALVFALWGTISPGGEAAPPDEVLTFAIGYGLLTWTGPALWAGLSELAWRLARFWALVPAIAIPAFVIASLYAFQGVLRSRADDLVHAVSDCLDARSLEMLTDPFAGTSAIPGPLTVPTLLAQAGEAFFDPPARVAFDAFRGELLSALSIGLAPGVALSIAALFVGYRAGYAVRHEADLERIRGAREGSVSPRS